MQSGIFNIWREPYKLPHNSMFDVYVDDLTNPAVNDKALKAKDHHVSLWSIVIWTSQKLRRRWFFFSTEKLNSFSVTCFNIYGYCRSWAEMNEFPSKWFICVLLNYRTYIMWQISQWNWWGTQSFQLSVWLTKPYTFSGRFYENSLRTAYFWSQLIIKVISVIRFSSLVLLFIYSIHLRSVDCMRCEVQHIEREKKYISNRFWYPEGKKK